MISLLSLLIFQNLINFYLLSLFDIEAKLNIFLEGLIKNQIDPLY